LQEYVLVKNGRKNSKKMGRKRSIEVYFNFHSENKHRKSNNLRQNKMDADILWSTLYQYISLLQMSRKLI